MEWLDDLQRRCDRDVRRANRRRLLAASGIRAASDTSDEESSFNNELAILHAAGSGDVSGMRNWLRKGANINVKGENRETAMHIACRNGHLRVAKFLVDNGAEINAKRSNDGWTPLNLAHFHGYLDIVKLLIENGAGVNEKSTFGDTPLHYAGMYVDMKKRNGHHHQSKISKLLIKNGANVNAKDNRGETPLHRVCHNGALLKLLIDHGADVNVKNNYGKTPFHWACWKGHLKIAKLLAENYGADIDTKESKKQETPLHTACKKGRLEMVKLLQSQGANLNAETRKGSTPLHLACKGNHLHVMFFLVRQNPFLVSTNKKRKPKSRKRKVSSTLFPTISSFFPTGNKRATKKASYRYM